MIKDIDKTVEKYNMVSSGDKILVGCSGGADSMLLLNYFLSSSEKYGITVEVAHVEHGIRGKESLDDAEFVKEFCLRNNIKFHLISIDAVTESKKFSMGVEEYSRKRRYEFFNSINCDKIATAHNLNDNIETVLFRIARGTGLKGICGIPAVRDKIIRPLIEIDSEKIRQYCDENGINYRVDSTNNDNDYSRNFIRNNIVPLMKEINSDFIHNMSSTINSIKEDNEFIACYSNEIYNHAVSEDKFSLDILNKYPLSVKKRVILIYFENHGVALDRVHLNLITELCNKSSRQQISGNKYAVSDGKFLRFVEYDDINSEKRFVFVTKILNKNEFSNKNVDFYCDYDKIVGNVSVRRRAEGDKIRPYRRNCTKTLKKLFNELKIPDESRCGIGVVTDEKGVIGVIGFCVDERVAVTPETQNILSIILLSEDENE